MARAFEIVATAVSQIFVQKEKQLVFTIPSGHRPRSPACRAFRDPLVNHLQFKETNGNRRIMAMSLWKVYASLSPKLSIRIEPSCKCLASYLSSSNRQPHNFVTNVNDLNSICALPFKWPCRTPSATNLSTCCFSDCAHLVWLTTVCCCYFLACFI